MASGKTARSVFTERQNRVLRGALKAYARERKLSQANVGDLLGIAQQNAGRLLKRTDAGFSYDTAKRLSRVLGFAGVDAFFAAKGLQTDGQRAQH